MSADSRYVTFECRGVEPCSRGTPISIGISLCWIRQTGLATRVNMATGGAQANDLSMTPVISADGRYVAFFYSRATNLVLGDSNPKAEYLCTRSAGRTNNPC